MKAKLICACGYTLEFPQTYGKEAQVMVEHCPVCNLKTKQTLLFIWLYEMGATQGYCPKREVGKDLWQGFVSACNKIIEKDLELNRCQNEKTK